jgi:hypothetical protein
MMIADFAMSLSRKRQDKVNGTGRIHIQKNRYGMDGMTYQAKVNTSNGLIEIDVDPLSEDDITRMQTSTESSGSSRSFGSSLDREEKAYLASKFFELNI